MPRNYPSRPSFLAHIAGAAASGLLFVSLGAAVSVGLWQMLPSKGQNGSGSVAAMRVDVREEQQPASAPAGGRSPRVVYVGPIVASGSSTSPAQGAARSEGPSHNIITPTSAPVPPSAPAGGTSPAASADAVSPTSTAALDDRPADPVASTSAPDQARPSVRLIDLNTASVEELNALEGGGMIGRAIIRGRPYTSVEDLLAKRVLNRATYQRIADQIAVR